MNDPYSILGVSRSSSDEDIKAAYRALAIKYSPDNYVADPLSDIAEQRMEEVNTAFDQIMNERRLGRGQRQSYASTEAEPTSDGSRARYVEIRRMLAAKRTADAEGALMAIEPPDRNAEWNFLMGSVCSAKGWLDEAYNYFSAAASMDPGNREYASAKRRMDSGRSGRAAGNPYSGGYNTSRGSSDCCGGASGCDICTSLICADCCCECMGGDLIHCC